MHPDYRPYFDFTKKSRLDKSINSLMGFIEGITIDHVVNEKEIGFLEDWIKEQELIRHRHPYNELIPYLEQVLADRVLTKEEQEDVLWLCERLVSKQYFDQITCDLQRLHAVIGGITADAAISECELTGLATWLNQRNYLTGCWPYDEVCSLITSVMQDGKIDSAEHQLLLSYFSEFVSHTHNKIVQSPPVQISDNITGICAVCPDIEFSGKVFCFTGTSTKYTRKELSHTVHSLGGKVTSTPSKTVDYLIIGNNGNPCWAYACYGRKVERAIELRKAGVKILIIHENDFHDAVIDTVT